EADDLARFLRHVSDDRLFAAWMLLGTTGMRRGEVLGLKWSSVDLERRRLSVREALVTADGHAGLAEPKTARSRRSVPLPAQTVAAIRAHRAKQLEERIALGPDYADEDFVFCREDGAALSPQSFSRLFVRRCDSAGISRIRLHDLRHTFATLALEAGVHAKVVSEILGHSSISLTLDTYSHAIPSMQEEAAGQVAALVFGVD
ncbi:MAG TPA: site-specific integrase, partial [Actinomycetota bacterium]|nr:site-specific integrase [Actinomycetota bacterium]